MKFLKGVLLVAITGLIMAGCSSVAHIEKDDSVDFKNFHTFAWVETRNSQSDSGHTKVSDLTERNIRYAVGEELAKSGWKEVKHKPDVLLSYDVLVEKGVRDQSNPVYSQPFTRYYYNPYMRRWNAIYYPSQFWGYDNEQVPVREGTLTISMMDTQNGKTVWQGWTTNEVNSRNLTHREIESSVKSIFRKFEVASRN